jgi:hypothetical protein
MMSEESIVVDYDTFYVTVDDPSGLNPRWHFWFLNQQNTVISQPISIGFETVGNQYEMLLSVVRGVGNIYQCEVVATS